MSKEPRSHYLHTTAGGLLLLVYRKGRAGAPAFDFDLTLTFPLTLSSSVEVRGQCCSRVLKGSCTIVGPVACDPKERPVGAPRGQSSEREFGRAAGLVSVRLFPSSEQPSGLKDLLLALALEAKKKEWCIPDSASKTVHQCCLRSVLGCWLDIFKD